MSTTTMRNDIYYWKCDRASSFHGTDGAASVDESVMSGELERILRERFADFTLRVRPAGGQGNHRTFLADWTDTRAFVRVEDGSEGDDYFDVEAVVLGLVRGQGIQVPAHLGSDTSRKELGFAWQLLGRIEAKDLNFHLKAGSLPLADTAEKIGGLVARWQAICPVGFGPFDTNEARASGRLRGLHASYPNYFRLNLERHLRFLQDREFLSVKQVAEILDVIATHASLLRLESGCLVHKDLALWNILGTPEEILAVIDWDDAISGDPMDDLSLLGCFYDGQVMGRALEGYQSVRPLPPEYRRRFWLHLLRNMIVKSVIRVGAGYFERDSDFFLIGTGGTGTDLRATTLQRLADSLTGLRGNRDPREL